MIRNEGVASRRKLVAQLATRRRLSDVESLLGAEDATSDLDSFRRLSREHAEVGPVVALYRDYQAAESDLATAQEMLADPAMRDFAQSEIDAAKARMAALEADLQKALLPRDPNDERNMFLEIRAGTGGDESGLFAGDLYRMYTRYAERNRWQTEIVSESRGRAGRLSRSHRSRHRRRAPTRNSNSNRGRIACSAFPRPKRKGGSTPRRARSRSSPKPIRSRTSRSIRPT